jgi:hypothetical protein
MNCVRQLVRKLREATRTRWLAFAGWELNPLDSIEKFLSSTSDFLLSQAFPSATANLPQPPGFGARLGSRRSAK